ncbi:unnamed protein product [Victoria cruziana]
MCNVQPGANFTYTLLFSTEEGTIWYHAHSDWTRATVHGAIVVYPEIGTAYPFPRPHREYVVIISEWWKADIMEVLYEGYMDGVDFQISDAFMINGQPGDLYECSSAEATRFLVEQGKTYLLRVVNSAISAGHFFAIQDHNLTVVGRDANYLKPFTTNYAMINTGQTMDVLITADQPRNLYYMAANSYSAAPTPIGLYNTLTTAFIEYHGCNSSDTRSLSLPYLPVTNDTLAVYNFTVLQRSLASKDHPIDVPMEIDTRLVFTLSTNHLPCSTCEGPNGTRFAASMNNVTFFNPPIDILEAYYAGIKNIYTADFPSFPPFIFNFTSNDYPQALLLSELATKVKVLNYNATVELVLQGTNLLLGDNHPIHLHGYNFYVVGRGFGNFDPEKDPLGYNLVDPPAENTVGVPYSGWAVVRFRAANPGVWLMHCHLDRHYTWGMTAVFIVRDGPTAESSILPSPSYMPKCVNTSLYQATRPFVPSDPVEAK